MLHRPVMINSRTFRRIGLSVLACSFIWVLPRLVLFSEPLMLCDDYVSAALSNLYDVYFINEIRPLGGIYPMLCKTLFPNFFSTSMPLVLNGILVGVLGATMLRIMAQIGTAELPSWLLISGFLCHPAINDFTAWNSVGFHIVACIWHCSAFCWHGEAHYGTLYSDQHFSPFQPFLISSSCRLRVLWHYFCLCTTDAWTDTGHGTNFYVRYLPLVWPPAHSYSTAVL